MAADRVVTLPRQAVPGRIADGTTAPVTGGRSRLGVRGLGVVVAVIGAGFVVWGQDIAVPAATGLGAVLLAGLLLDFLALVVLRQRGAPQAAPAVTPNPVQAGNDVTVRAWRDGGRLSAGCAVRNPWTGRWNESKTAPGADGATCRMTAEWRGRFDVGPVRWVTPSPLGLWQQRCDDPVTSELTVWPATAPLVVPPPRRERARSTGLGPMKAHLDDTSLREYVPGDDLRRVQWRSLARGRKLMTRAEEPSPPHRAVGALWAAQGADADAVDLGLSLLASWGEAMLRARQDFELDVGGAPLRNLTRARLMDTLTSLDATSGLVPVAEAMADEALLVAVVGAGDVTLPAIADGGVAVVVAPAGAGVAVPDGWDCVRFDAARPPGVQDAVSALEQALAGGVTVPEVER